jgi:flagellar biosynthesis protein FliQ
MSEMPGALTREAFMLLATTAGPVIGALLVIGLLVGIFQAATQIQDPAVGFLPRFAAAILTVWMFGSWLMERYAGFFATSLARMAQH